MAGRKYYVICEQNCKFEGMTKEQILTAITQAVESGEIKDVDTGFVQTIKTINNKPLKFFVGDSSEYEMLTDEEKHNLFAVITNDTTKESIIAAINELRNEMNAEIDQIKNRLAEHEGHFNTAFNQIAKAKTDLTNDIKDGSIVAGEASALTNKRYYIHLNISCTSDGTPHTLATTFISTVATDENSLGYWSAAKSYIMQSIKANKRLSISGMLGTDKHVYLLYHDNTNVYIYYKNLSNSEIKVNLDDVANSCSATVITIG